MFEKIDTTIPGLYIIKPKVLADHRGAFVKLLHKDMFLNMGLKADFIEEYYSTSSKGVVRGLHFQIPPQQHVKCVTCLYGEIFDAVVDLRQGSPTYGKHFTLTINSDDPTILYIPEGMAHGFMAMTDNTVFLNKTTTVFSGDHDKGIAWNSCGIQWPDLPVIVSEKDQNMPAFDNYESPFKY